MIRFVLQRSIPLIAGLFLAASGPAAVYAQVVVEDAGSTANSENRNPGGQSSAANNSSGGASPAGSNSIIEQLYLQLQSLQQEIQTLRGMVEQQGYRIRQMEQRQQDRYLDLDSRLQELSGTGGGSAASGGSTAAASAGSGSQPQLDSLGVDGNLPSVESSAGSATGQASGGDDDDTGPRNEGELYRAALNLLLEEGDYEAAIPLFQQQIRDYPDGRLLPNAHYWRGEALILAQRYNQAINAFNRVIDEFPRHDKAPDAMLKLGIVYSLMGNTERANEVWRRIASQYPDSNSAALRLADEYLREGYTR